MKTINLLLSLLAWPLMMSAQTPSFDEGMRAVEKNIRIPRFANRQFDITRFGANPDSSARWNQQCINNAILTCSETGGGRVVVPAGSWRTGAIRLQSHVCLTIDKAAILSFVFDPSLYPLVQTRWEGMDVWNYSPLIYADNCRDVGISGEGVIDGGGSNKTWWPWCGKGGEKFGAVKGQPNQTDSVNGFGGGRPRLMRWNDQQVPVAQRIAIDGYLRPQMINICRTDGVLIEGVTLLRSPFWVTHPLLCRNVVFRKMKVINNGPNGDGFDPESCDGVLVEDCYFQTGDDCIAVKSGRNNDGRLAAVPTQNMIVRRCQMADGHGGVVLGSEISGGCRNIYVDDCTMDSPNLDRIIRIKSNPCRGGVVENLFVRNVKCGQCREAVLKINLDYEPAEASPRLYPPVVRGIYLENVTCEKSKYGVMTVGLKKTTNISNVHVKNCVFNGVTENRNYSTGKVEAVHYDNCTLNGKRINR